MRRGEVWWGEIPEEGPRPYLILSRDEAIDRLNRLIVVPATRTVREIPTEVLVDPDDGMPSPSAFSVDNVGSIPKSMLIERITELGPAKMEEVCQALAVATRC